MPKLYLFMNRKKSSNVGHKGPRQKKSLNRSFTDYFNLLRIILCTIEHNFTKLSWEIPHRLEEDLQTPHRKLPCSKGAALTTAPTLLSSVGQCTATCFQDLNYPDDFLFIFIFYGIIVTHKLYFRRTFCILFMNLDMFHFKILELFQRIYNLSINRFI